MNHFGRLGGIIVAPRRTLRRLLEQGEGSLWEVMPWLLVVAAAIAPTRAGRSLLIGRLDVIDGLLMFINMMSVRMLSPLIATGVAAAFLYAFARWKHGAQPMLRFDRILDVCSFCLFPLLILAALGAVLFHLGFELWFLPHRSLSGRTVAHVVRNVVAFGWSTVLFLLLANIVRTLELDAGPPPEAAATESTGSE